MEESIDGQLWVEGGIFVVTSNDIGVEALSIIVTAVKLHSVFAIPHRVRETPKRFRGAGFGSDIFDTWIFNMTVRL